MGLGASALITTAKKEIPGPPFASNSADNGLSVDATSGKIVLGNDQGDATAPAALLSNREIVMEDSGGNSFVILFNSLLNAVLTQFTGFSMEIAGADGTTPSITVGAGDGANAEIAITTGIGSSSNITVEAASGQAAIALLCNADLAQFEALGAGEVTFSVSDFGIPLTVITFYTTTQQMQFGVVQVAANGADVQISGSSTRRYLINGKGAVTYNVDRDLDSDKLFINSGAATFVLPNMTGANNRSGFIFRVAVKNGAGVIIQASGGQILRFGNLTTSAGGTARDTTVGAVATLMWDGTDWVAESFIGAWTFT
jgi:hypothetical protein